MSLTCGVGKGKHPEVDVAAAQAVTQCLAQLGGKRPDVVLLLASVHYPQQRLLDQIRKAFPAIPLVGCSTAGEIMMQEPDERSVVVAGLAGLEVVLAAGGRLASDSRQAGAELGRCLTREDSPLTMILSDGLEGDGAAVLRGLQAERGPKGPLIGGAAADDYLYKRTYQYLNDEVKTGSVIAAQLRGDFHFGVGVRHGWQPIGLPVTVTRSLDNRVFEINGYPALSFFKEYFGDYTSRLGTQPFARLAIYYPLGLAVPDSSEFLLRAPMSVEADGSVTFAAEIPEGSKVRLMIGDVDKAMQAARIAAMEALSQMKGRLPKFAIIFDCVARRRLFGRSAGQEIQLVSEILGKHVPILGFYTYGEIAPMEGKPCGPAVFHNETIVILTMG